MITKILKNLIEWIKILLCLYYYNFISNYTLIILKCKIIVLFNHIFLILYSNYYFKNFLYKTNSLFFTNQIIYKILNIKIISKTTKSKIIRKFAVISAIGNKKNWIGIGRCNHKYLELAAKQAYKRAFQNIYYFNLKKFQLLFLKLKNKSTTFILHKYYLSQATHCQNLTHIFNLIGFFISSKIIGVSKNIPVILQIIKNLRKI